MDVEALERSLVELNEFERAYRDGTQQQWCFPPKFLVQEDGCLRIKKAIFLDFTGGSGIGRGRKPMTYDQLLFVFRTLRFEPAPEHMHDFLEFLYVYRGACHQRVNGEELTLTEGEILFLDSDCPHQTHPLGADDIVISICVERRLFQHALETLHSSSDWFSSVVMDALDEQSNHNRYVHLHASQNRRVRSLVQELLCEYIDPSPNAGRLLAGLFQLLLLELLGVYEGDMDREARERDGRRVSAIPIISYIQKHYLECSLESVAEQFYVSPNYVSRILKQSIGKTYSQLVQELRLSHAASLIEVGGYSAEEAARTVGYTNMSFFYRKFRESFGATPAEYRAHSLM